MAPKLEEIHELAQSAVAQGREVLLSYFGQLSKVKEKELAGLVSEADVESEKLITTALKTGLGGVDVLGEEASFSSGLASTSELKPGTRWILDPLDGTTNYVHGLRWYAISLALEWEGEIIYGTVDMPSLGETYYALKGKGAYKGDSRLKVSARKNLSEALVATGFSSHRKDILKTQLAIFENVIPEVRAVRRAGAAAYDLCLVAEGIYDAYWERGLSAWDVAAGALILEEAGGQTSDYLGGKFSCYQDTIVATNSKIHDSLVQKIQLHSPVKN